MSESYQIPDWLKSELPEEELQKLSQLAGEHRTKTLAPLAATLEGTIHEVLDEMKASGKSDKLEALTTAFNQFRSTAFPAAPSTTSRTAARSNGSVSPAAARDRDSKREVAIWKASTAVLEKLGHASITAAKNAGCDTKGLRLRVIELLDAGNEDPAASINPSDYAPGAAANASTSDPVPASA